MLRSMTGFGRSVLEDSRWMQTWEVRSVNGRHLDIRWRLPHDARMFEGVLEKIVRQAASRGRIEISLHLQPCAQAACAATLNVAQVDAFFDAVAAYAQSRGDDFIPDYNRLLVHGMFWNDTAEDMDETLSAVLLEGLRMALDDWNESRATEGKALAHDLSARFVQMENWADTIATSAPLIKQDRLAQVRERVSEMLEALDKDLEETRFLQEIVLLADRLDVTEELIRLQAHFARLHELVHTEGDVGRKLDFTLQECFREIATCGNKIQDLQVSRLVVDMKNELEKCREQVQNIE